jgi:hypothetical protein
VSIDLQVKALLAAGSKPGAGFSALARKLSARVAAGLVPYRDLLPCQPPEPGA